MKQMYIKKINDLLAECNDLSLIDLVWRILAKSAMKSISTLFMTPQVI